MLDHMTFRVKDIARTKSFYEAALKPLGDRLACEAFHGNNIEACCHVTQA